MVMPIDVKVLERELNVDEEFLPMASDIQHTLGDKRIHFFGMDYGGARDLEVFLQVLERLEIPLNYTVSNVQMSNAVNRSGFRKVYIRPAEIPADVQTYIAFEDQAGRTGISAVSGPINIGLEIRKETIPPAPIELATFADRIGIANYSLFILYNSFVGVSHYIMERMPDLYRSFEESGILGLFSTKEPRRLSDYATPSTWLPTSSRWGSYTRQKVSR